MTEDRYARTDWAPTAVAIRLVAFLVATASVVAIPVVIVAASAGILSRHSALIAAVVAFVMVIAAALVVRPFDPLRG